MRYQVQPNKASCFITSVACVIDKNVQKLISMLGHDGLDMIMCNGVMKLRGFHYEEIVRLLLELEYLMIPIHSQIDIFNYKTMDSGLPPYTEKFNDIEKIMQGREGVITDRNTHACAWSEGVIYDPKKDITYNTDIFKEYYGDIFCFYYITRKT
jgi:hypothetical protein